MADLYDILFVIYIYKSSTLTINNASQNNSSEKLMSFYNLYKY